MKKYGIYCITCASHGKKYIGQSKDIEWRWRTHIYEAFNPKSKKHNYPLYNAIRKYGVDAFNFEILYETPSRDRNELLHLERYFYDEYLANGVDMYNVVRPSISVEMTKEIRDKLRKAQLGRKQSEETKRKSSISRTGLKRSIEAIKKTSEANRGKKTY